MTPRARSLKLAARALIEAVGGVEAVALFCRVGKSQLAEYASLNGDKYMPADVVADLEAAAASPIFTRQLAGFELDAVASPETAGDVMAATCLVTKDTGDVMRGVGAALADGPISPAEAREIEAAANLLIEHAITLRHAAQAVM